MRTYTKSDVGRFIPSCAVGERTIDPKSLAKESSQQNDVDEQMRMHIYNLLFTTALILSVLCVPQYLQHVDLVDVPAPGLLHNEESVFLAYNLLQSLQSSVMLKGRSSNTPADRSIRDSLCGLPQPF